MPAFKKELSLHRMPCFHTVQPATRAKSICLVFVTTAVDPYPELGRKTTAYKASFALPKIVAVLGSIYRDSRLPLEMVLYRAAFNLEYYAKE